MEISADAVDAVKNQLRGSFGELITSADQEYKRMAQLFNLYQHLEKVTTIALPRALEENGVNTRMDDGDVRATIHVKDIVFVEHLYQIVDYYPVRRDAAGRRFSQRFGIIGRSMRLEQSLGEGEAMALDANPERSLITDWGMTKQEARAITRARPAYLAVILRGIFDDDFPIGVLFVDSTHRNKFGDNNIASNVAITLEKPGNYWRFVKLLLKRWPLFDWRHRMRISGLVDSRCEDQMIPYTRVADEYYDPIRHPTCANFEELSKKFLEPVIRAMAGETIRVLDVGAGRSLAAAVIANFRSRLDHCVLLDISPAMLGHSSEWQKLGATLVMPDARNTGLPSNSFQVLVSSLGDPYNNAQFWAEAHRLLCEGGTCLFTTPTPEWADWFRPAAERSEAQFDLVNGQTIHVPSHVPSLERQVRMIQQAGFRISEIQSFFASDVSGPLSAKLKPPGDGRARIPILRGFKATRLAE